MWLFGHLNFNQGAHIHYTRIHILLIWVFRRVSRCGSVWYRRNERESSIGLHHEWKCNWWAWNLPQLSMDLFLGPFLHPRYSRNLQCSCSSLSFFCHPYWKLKQREIKRKDTTFCWSCVEREWMLFVCTGKNGEVDGFYRWTKNKIFLKKFTFLNLFATCVKKA